MAKDHTPVFEVWMPTNKEPKLLGWYRADAFVNACYRAIEDAGYNSADFNPHECVLDGTQLYQSEKEAKSLKGAKNA